MGPAKAVETICLWPALHAEALQLEIDEGTNVVERWGGATDFAFFARRGEAASNCREHHEIGMLALHPIPSCRVCIGTPVIQTVPKPH